jgi:Rhomboid family
VHVLAAAGAGALGGYLYRNRNIQRSSEQLLVIGGVVAFNLLLGIGEDNFVDNTGHIAGLIAGGWLGFGMAPQFVVLPRQDGMLDSSSGEPKGEGSGSWNSFRVTLLLNALCAAWCWRARKWVASMLNCAQFADASLTLGAFLDAQQGLFVKAFV